MIPFMLITIILSCFLMGVLVSLMFFQPAKRLFDKLINNIIYKNNYSTEEFLDTLNKSLSVTTDLRALLEKAAYTIGEALKSEQAFFFVNTFNDHYITAGTSNHKRLPKDDAIKFDNTLEVKEKSVIVASLRPLDDPIRRLMVSHRIEIVLPLVKDHKTISYLCLGDHLSSGYTSRDIKVLKTISNELTIAIQNALAVLEVREFNTILQQEVANATKELRTSNTTLRQLDKAKDEFVSMASHQLRTPLTSVKGYISMVLEGDVGKISDAQRQLLGEAFNSSERMVRLIGDFLNVSRLQTGKFIIDKYPIDLSKLVEQEVDSLQSYALARQMELIYHRPTDFPVIDVDESKIRQVVMNFTDNALYYSKGYSSINISLSVVGNNAVFTVKDYGIGVPYEEQAKLFTKFYRASNAKKARPDGTGVGLYLAKKIIIAHNGKMIFESIEGKGSTFGFSLPIKQV